MAKRTDGEGTIYFEKSRKKWHVAVTDKEGNRIHKRFNSEEEADAWRLNMAAKFKSGNYVVKQDITIGEWIIKYLDTFAKPKVRIKTFNDYLDIAMHISEEFAEKKLQKLSPLEVQAFLNSLDGSAFVQEKVGKLLRRVSKKAYEVGIIEKDFTIGVEIKHPKRKNIEVFSVLEIQKIFHTLETTNILRHHYLFVALAVASGCRMGELLGLTPDDIEDDAIVIRRAVVESRSKVIISPPKTEAGYRRVTLPPALIATLKYEASKRRHDDFIFKNNKGNPYRTSNVGKSWQTILRYAEIPYRKFHCLRHTHATLLLAAGVPVTEVAKRLGHSRPSHTLNLYSHAIIGYDKNLPNLINTVFKLDKPQVEASTTVYPVKPCYNQLVETTLSPKEKFAERVMKNKKPGA